MQPTPNGKKIEDVLSALVDLIEEIRVRRQAEAAEALHPELKTFSQRELNDVACPSYKNYLLGRSHRLPQRDMVIQIADYLECTPAERDDLLMCAGYMPESLRLTDDQYNAALQRAQLLMHLLPLPAVVIGRYGETIATNQAVFTKIDRPVLAEWQPQTRNIVSYFFDPALAVRDYYAVSSADWQVTATGAAQLLYLTNMPRLREPAFRHVLRQHQQLPDFAAAWQAVIAHPPSVLEANCEMRMQTTFLEQPITELNTILPITAGLEVSIVIGVPVDEAARHVYSQIGCVPELVQWQQMLKDFSALSG